LEQAPSEIETFIQPSDSKVFAECLDTFEVSRFELDTPKGSPRSFSLKFGFKENEYFQDRVLEKKFWFRKTRDWAGLVSEPVKINWKKGQDLTAGLTDAACELSEIRKKGAIDTSSAEARKKETESKEYKRLAQMIETATDASMSFFGIFAFVSGFRWVSAEENEKTLKEDNERLEKIRRGEKVEDEDDEDEEDSVDYQECEVFPGGDEVATIIAEDMWPNAIKYYSMLMVYRDAIQSNANQGQNKPSKKKKKTTRTSPILTRPWTPVMRTIKPKKTIRRPTKRSTFAPSSARVANLVKSPLRKSSARPRQSALIITKIS